MLRHKKIILRSLEDDDKLELARLANNKKIWDNVRDYPHFPYTIDDAFFLINLIKQEKPQLSFALEWEGRFCGVIGLTAQTDVYRKKAEIGYWIGEPFWNNGIATEAVRLITDYEFSELGYVRIHTGVLEFNIGSMKVLEKNGYKKDGIFEKTFSRMDKF